ncbi:MAG TPA: hypothetical protein PLJ42_03015 [Chitinophagales bacterium]|nr:hypothetical protein [Chitinophagales bacterium]MBP6155050.1 hypothetical protein [Chitinophagales bacterium]HQV77319.1 hypothetical protein [Chitinophagales bacterium]HQW78380.1 hypothetical protein [Chitinophagales bacterium]HRB19430.1 hypothetical protein [Chitinophagales bacterium]
MLNQVMYEAINERIEELVAKTNYPSKYVVLIGVIFINGDKDMRSFCSYKRFDYIDLATPKRESLMNEFYAYKVRLPQFDYTAELVLI